MSGENDKSPKPAEKNAPKPDKQQPENKVPRRTPPTQRVMGGRGEERERPGRRPKS